MGIYRRGKVYWARWSEDRKLRRQSLETKDRREAERLYEKLVTGDAGLRVREVLKRWFQYKEARSKPRSLDLYTVVRKRFTLIWGDRRPEEITSVVVEEFQEQALRAGLSPRTINQQLGHVLSALKWAHERGLVANEPPKHQRLKVDGRPSRKYLTPSEVAKLLATVREPRWQRLEIVVRLALYAGLRQQEIVWLTWEDVDLEGGWLHVRSKRGWSPKSSSSERSIPIADDLAGTLANASRVCDLWVAPQSPGTQWCRPHLGDETRKLFRAAGVDDGGRHTLHRLRGTFATTVLRGGGDLESLREVLGHSVLSVTAGYLAATSESKRRAVEGVRFDAEPKAR